MCSPGTALVFYKMSTKQSFIKTFDLFQEYNTYTIISHFFFHLYYTLHDQPQLVYLIKSFFSNAIYENKFIYLYYQTSALTIRFHLKIVLVLIRNTSFGPSRKLFRCYQVKCIISKHLLLNFTHLGNPQEYILSIYLLDR